VESEVGMTPEELELTLREVDEKLAAFPADEKKLTGKEWRQKIRLQQEKEILEKIQKARKNGDTHQEIKQMARYALLRDSKKMNPILSYLMQLKLRSHIWM